MKRLVEILVGLMLATTVQAQELAPDALVRNITEEILEVIRKDKDIQAGDAKKAAALVESKALPHFNFTHMTQLALARDWRHATPAQQKALSEEFRTLLLRTYSTALSQYKNQTIEYRSQKNQPEDTDIKVRTEIRQAGAKSIPLDYFMEKQGKAWKVYDIEVSGVSLILNYRETFAAEVRLNGIDGLIRVLQAKNNGNNQQPK